jgi:eukaryotic-like serine/threonine-protein kinase
MLHCTNSACKTQLSIDARWCHECGSVVAARPGDILGDYLIEQHVEDGAVGSIWKARRLSDQRIFAIKILPYDRFPEAKQKAEAIARFEQEIKAVNQIEEQKQHFVPIIEVSVTSEGSPYFVMEFLEGLPLSRYLAQQKILCGAEILDLMQQLCQALQAVHQHPSRIIHRDIKPDNIFLVPQAEHSHLVKVLDFGLAKLDRKLSLTRTGDALGTPHYMAPEQWQNAKYVDQRADVYAVGLILFEMLTGQRTFAAADSIVEIMRSHVLYPPPAPSGVVPWRRLPSALDFLVQVMLAKQPIQRPSSCAEVLRQLTRALGSLAHEGPEALQQKHQ